MANLVLRNVKGTALTFQEGDSNYLALDSDSPWNVAEDRIYYAGRVGIGPNSSNPTYHLDFGSGVANEATIGTRDADMHFHVDGARKLKVTTNAQERLTLSTTGKFGIGETNPQYELDVGGYANVSNTLYANAVEANSFTDGTLTISGGSILNAKRIVSTTQIDWTQLYDRATGYRVTTFDDVVIDNEFGIPLSSAVYRITDSLGSRLDSEHAWANSNFDSEHAWNIAEHNRIDSNADSEHAWNVSEHNQINANADSEHAWNIDEHDLLQDQIDSLNSKLVGSGLQEITDISNTTTNVITTSTGVQTPKVGGGHQGFVGLQFGSAVLPLNTSGALSTGLVDMGSASNKYKDAYFSGTVNTGSFVKTGGTNAQFLMADGSVKTEDAIAAGSLYPGANINGTAFDGTTNITTDNWGTARNVTIGDTLKSVNGSVDYSWTITEVGITKANIDPLNIAASTAATLTPGRNINGTAFDGSADITTVNWGTARNITIGDTLKSVNGSTTYNWTKAEIGITKANIDALGIAATTAGSLTPGANINGTLFTGAANITTANWGTARNISIGGTAKSVNGSTTYTWTTTEIGITKANIDALGIAATTAATLTPGRNINGTLFTGAANITTANWGTARNLTLGGTTKSVNGSTNYTWTTAELGITKANIDALGVVGGSVAQALTIQGTSYNGSVARTVTFTGSTGIDVTGTTITNTAPDQTVSLTGAGGLTVSGTYPNFTLTQAAGAAYTAGTGLTLVGTEFRNAAPDQTVTMASGTGISVTGTYPNFTVTNSAPDQTVALTGGTNVTVTGTYPNFTIASTDTTYSVGNGLKFDVAPNQTRILMSGTYTGEFTATGDIVAFSDIGLKSNVNLITAALEKVGRIGGYTFNKEGTEERRTGVIAQEIQEVLPEAVHTNEDGILGVAYGNLTGLLIEAVKELNAKVKDLESKLGV